MRMPPVSEARTTCEALSSSASTNAVTFKTQNGVPCAGKWEHLAVLSEVGPEDLPHPIAEDKHVPAGAWVKVPPF